ncbi:MAG: glycosyl transferase family 4, partial [bacterium]
MFKEILKRNNLIKKNYLDKEIPVLGGLYIVIFSIVLWIFFFNHGSFINNHNNTAMLDYNPDKSFVFNSMIYLFIIITAVGFLDDLAGSKNQQGFKGHFKSLFSGEITTGFIKAFVSFLLVFLVLFSYGFQSYFRLFLNLGIIILMTNFINLLDLRPARSIKFFLLFSFILILFLPLLSYFFPVYLVLFFYLPFELKARVMLGDTGANFLGIVLGFPLIFINNLLLEVIILFFLILLTIISEKYSFSTIIKNNKYLNYLDEL